MTGATRRRYLATAGALGGTAAATACGTTRAPAENPAATGPRQKIEVWRPGTPEDRPWGVTVDGVIAEFGKAQERWDVELIYPGDMYEQKLTTQVVAGTPPAAFRGWVRSVQAMAPSDQLMPLDNYVKNEKG